MPAAKRSLDELSAVLQSGHQARETLAAIAPLLDERQKQIVHEAVGAFRLGTCEGARAISYLAALSEVVALREALEHRIRRGEAAAKEVFGEPPVKA